MSTVYSGSVRYRLWCRVRSKGILAGPLPHYTPSYARVRQAQVVSVGKVVNAKLGVRLYM